MFDRKTQDLICDTILKKNAIVDTVLSKKLFEFLNRLFKAVYSVELFENPSRYDIIGFEAKDKNGEIVKLMSVAYKLNREIFKKDKFKLIEEKQAVEPHFFWLCKKKYRF